MAVLVENEENTNEESGEVVDDLAQGIDFVTETSEKKPSSPSPRPINKNVAINLLQLTPKTDQVFKRQFTEMFAGVENAFYELIEEAGEAKQREARMEHMQEVRKKKPLVEDLFLSTINSQLQVLKGEQPDELDAGLASISADSLSLVEEEELEQQVSIKNMATKALFNAAEELNKLTQRMELGFQLEELEEEENPFGPFAVAENFGESCRRFGVPLDYLLVIYREFERSIMANLSEVLAAANAELSRQGILPDATVVHKSSGSPGGGGGGASEGAATGNSEEVSEDTQQLAGNAAAVTNGANASAQGQATQQSQTADQGAQTKSTSVPIDPELTKAFTANDPVVQEIHNLIAKDGYTVLQKLIGDSKELSSARISSSGTEDTDYESKQEVDDDQLINILNDLQGQSVDSEMQLRVGKERVKLADELGSQLHKRSEQTGKGQALSQGGNDVVNLVDMLFDFILEDDYLPDAVKSIISDLQVPLTKVALLDNSFFSDTQHPARVLLNALSKAGMAVEDSENLESDKAYQNISGVVERVQQDFDQETSVFESVLSDFSQKVEKDNKRVAVLEQRTRDVEKGKAKTEHAEQMASKLIKQALGMVPVSPEVEEFLQEGWRNVLVLTCLRFGAHSKQWKNDVLLTQKMMKSFIVAKKARLSNKKMRVPTELIDLLGKGLERISFNPLESKRLLSGLEDTYAAISMATPERVREELKQALKDKKAKKRSEQKAAEEKVQAEEQPHEKAASVEGQDIFKGKVIPNEPQEKVELREKFEPKEAPKKSSLDEKLSSSDQDILKAAVTEEIEEEENNEQYVAGNAWYDMASQLPIGAWLELPQGGQKAELRCKLVANIKTLEKLIFVNKSGVKVAEKTITELAEELEKQESRIVNDNTIFDQALESVIINLREEKPN